MRIAMSNYHEVYDKLAEKYKLVGDEHFMEFLTMLLTPGEGDISWNSPKPRPRRK